MIVEVAERFRPYTDAALARLQYLYPKINFVLIADGIEVSGNIDIPSETLSREIHYALYREKIYAETLPMRRALIEAVTHR